MAAKQQAQRHAALRLSKVEHAFDELGVRGGAAEARHTISREADRLAADIAFAEASLEVQPRRSARPRVLGLDARLFVADLRRMHREARPGS